MLMVDHYKWLFLQDDICIKSGIFRVLTQKNVLQLVIKLDKCKLNSWCCHPFNPLTSSGSPSQYQHYPQ